MARSTRPDGPLTVAARVVNDLGYATDYGPLPVDVAKAHDRIEDACWAAPLLWQDIETPSAWRRSALRRDLSVLWLRTRAYEAFIQRLARGRLDRVLDAHADLTGEEAQPSLAPAASALNDVQAAAYWAHLRRDLRALAERMENRLRRVYGESQRAA